MLEEFKQWLHDNNYGFVSEPMNTQHYKMFEAYKAGQEVRMSRSDNLLNEGYLINGGGSIELARSILGQSEHTKGKLGSGY